MHKNGRGFAATVDLVALDKTMARSVTMNVLIGALVVWTVTVMLWLTILSGNWNTIGCRDSRERLQARINTSDAEVSPPHASTSPQTALAKRLLYYSSQIETNISWALGAPVNCTLIVQTYKRAEILPKFLSHYCKIAAVQKILVVWNDVNETYRPLMHWTDRCRAELRFIKSGENRITNRYIPRKEIETDCVFLVDDDQLVSVYDLHFGMEVWQNSRHLLVGFEESSFIQDDQGRYIYTHHQQQRYIGVLSIHKHPRHKIEIRNGIKILHVGNRTYTLGKAAVGTVKSGDNSSAKPEGYSIMKTPCFVHKAYLEMYFDPLMVPAGAVEYVDSLRNCEDILFSIVVTKFLQDSNRPQSGVLAVKPSLSIKNLELEAVSHGGNEDLSKRPDYHDERSKCLHKFSELYGYLPLRLSNTIATLI